MPQIYEPNYHTQHDLYIHELVFMRTPEADSVSMFGTFRETPDGRLTDRDYGCEFDQLTDLLLLAGRDGDLLIEQIATVLCNDRIDPDEPVSIDVNALLGHSLKIKNLRLQIYKPKRQDETGNWTEWTDEYYLIDSFKTLNAAQQQALWWQRAFETKLQLLTVSYVHYRQLRRHDFRKKEARRRTGLQDDLLFSLAKAHYRLQQAEKEKD